VENIPVLELPPPGIEEADTLFVLLLQGGIAVPVEWQRRADEWMAKPEGLGRESTIELLLRSDRVLWRPGRAMIQGAPERFSENLAGLADFAFHEGELRKLEREIIEDWDTAEADIKLISEVGKEEVARWPHVNEMTYRSGRRRMRISRLVRRLEKASITLPPAAQRIVSELIVQTETADRLKAVDDRLEAVEDIYELATDRISEYTYFSKECKLEIYIVIILAVELALIIFECWQTYHYAGT
jgi:hypothetical protein